MSDISVIRNIGMRHIRLLPYLTSDNDSEIIGGCLSLNGAAFWELQQIVSQRLGRVHRQRGRAAGRGSRRARFAGRVRLGRARGRESGRTVAAPTRTGRVALAQRLVRVRAGGHLGTGQAARGRRHGPQTVHWT